MAHKKIQLMLLWVFFFTAMTFAWAGPPTDIQLTYDLDKQVLHVEAKHPSDDIEKYYIRKMSVAVNGGDPVISYYTGQTEAGKFVTDAPITAKAEDHISVELWASDGGSGTQEMVIPKLEKENTKP